MRVWSESELSEVWDRWEAGESQRSISRGLGRSPSSIRTHLVSSGFRRPVPGLEWSPLRLSLREREEISRGLAAGESMRCIAGRLGEGLRRRFLGRWGPTVAGMAIELRQLIGCLGIGLVVPNLRSWR